MNKLLKFDTQERLPSRSRCEFVPPQVLENLAREGIEPARLSVQQSAASREDRAAQVIDMEVLTLGAAPGKGARRVYDSQNKWVKRVKLVRDEGKPVTGDDAVDKVYDSAGTARKFWNEKLNRDSIDNLGMDIVLNVHFGVKYMNAFWDGKEVTFGDGDGKIFVSFTESLDVVAHELGHGVTQNTANLVYKNEPGALNEHFSDVFGSVITQYAEKQSAHEADWLVGDEIMGPDLYGEALRSMKAPGTAYDNSLLGKDPQPDHMDGLYTGPGDNGGVHINSGIPNKAFYLVAHDIGTEQAALIWYTALQKLWSTASFNDAVHMIVNSSRLLIKAKKADRGSTQVVREAFRKVGLPR